MPERIKIFREMSRILIDYIRLFMLLSEFKSSKPEDAVVELPYWLGAMCFGVFEEFDRIALLCDFSNFTWPKSSTDDETIGSLATLSEPHPSSDAWMGDACSSIYDVYFECLAPALTLMADDQLRCFNEGTKTVCQCFFVERMILE